MQNVYTVERDAAIGLDGTLWKLNETQPPQKVMDNVVSVMADFHSSDIYAIDRSSGLWWYHPSSGEFPAAQSRGQLCLYRAARVLG